MVQVRYGGQNGQQYELAISDEHIVVRTENRSALVGARPFEVAPVSPAARSILNEFELATRFRQAGVEILRTKVPTEGVALRDRARVILNQEPEVQFAGRVLIDPVSQQPIIYTENLFLKFNSEEELTVCQEVVRRYDLTIKRQLEYAPNAYFVSASANTGIAIFDIAEAKRIGISFAPGATPDAPKLPFAQATPAQPVPWLLSFPGLGLSLLRVT